MWCRRAGDRGALMRGCPGRLKKSGTFFSWENVPLRAGTNGSSAFERIYFIIIFNELNLPDGVIYSLIPACVHPMVELLTLVFSTAMLDAGGTWDGTDKEVDVPLRYRITACTVSGTTGTPRFPIDPLYTPISRGTLRWRPPSLLLF